MHRNSVRKPHQNRKIDSTTDKQCTRSTKQVLSMCLFTPPQKKHQPRKKKRKRVCSIYLCQKKCFTPPQKKHQARKKIRKRVCWIYLCQKEQGRCSVCVCVMSTSMFVMSKICPEEVACLWHTKRTFLYVCTNFCTLCVV